MTDESRKAFEAQCLSSLIGYTTITGRFEYTDTTTQDQWVVWQRAWQARDAEVAAKDARIAEYEQMVCMQGAERVQLVKELCAAAKERDQLRATLAAIERDVGERPERLDTDSDAVYAMALADHHKHRAEHLALRNVRLVDLVEQLQWGFNHSKCPICAGFNAETYGETDYAHTKTCPVAEAIAANAVKE